MWLRLRCWQQYFAFPYWFFTIIIAVNKIIISLDINENNKFCVLRLVIISLSITINILVVRTLFLDSTWRSMLYFLSQILQESCIQSLFCICMIRMLFVFKILKYFLKSIHWKRLLLHVRILWNCTRDYLFHSDLNTCVYGLWLGKLWKWFFYNHSL